MRILFLDLASRKPAIALSTEKEILGLIQRDEKLLEHELMPFIEEVLKNAGCSYNNLTHIACVTGPGGYTSLRLGVATANALAYSLKIPIAGVPASKLPEPMTGVLPPLLAALPYGDPPVAPAYGNKPFITPRKLSTTFRKPINRYITRAAMRRHIPPPPPLPPS